MFGGILFGYFLRPEFGIIPENYSQNIGSWLILPGQLFLKLVQMIMIPLLFSSIITGLVSNTNENLKKLGLKVGMYFIFTTAFSVTLGVILTYFFKPGKLLGFRASPTSISNESNIDIDLPSMISNILPDNPLASMVSGEMLSIVIFTIIIGIAITQLKTATKSPVMRLLSAIQEICMTIVKWSMNLVPIAVFGFLANLVSTIGFASLKGVGLYIATVLVALFILLVFYLLIVLILGKRNPFVFLRDIRDVQLLAFSTTSSAAVMPLSIKTAQEKLKISPSVSNFLIPIGATINMDGTAV
jgi:Na+/H+-dicarboxylate symporter